VTLHGGSREEIRQAVATAIQQLGPRGFIMAPVCSLDPDTPWSSVEIMIETWEEFREIN
jgi:uroporphyrinogen-III decarboxylase